MSENSGPKSSVSCLRPGIPESDTAESGEESEPTYRHYDNFETDVCLTQDEDEDDTSPHHNVVIDVGRNINAVGTPSATPSIGIAKRLLNSVQQRSSPPVTPKETGINGGAGVVKAVSSDSDSCAESELTVTQGQATDDTTTTSTSESEETQM